MLGMTLFELHQDLWQQKARVTGYCMALFAWSCI